MSEVITCLGCGKPQEKWLCFCIAGGKGNEIYCSGCIGKDEEKKKTEACIAELRKRLSHQGGSSDCHPSERAYESGMADAYKNAIAIIRKVFGEELS